jgi:membrane-bound lytic murein transglycosylase A
MARLVRVAHAPSHFAGDVRLAVALQAFQRQAREIIQKGAGFRTTTVFGGGRNDWLPVCEAALSVAHSDAEEFFREQFVTFKVEDKERPAGLFTGYYEPEAEGSLKREGPYQVPVYGKPADLVAFTEDEAHAAGLRYGRRMNGLPRPYLERKAIEEGSLEGQGLEICFLKSWVEAFFIHIQGSGRVRLPDGRALRLTYAAKSGLPYTGVGYSLIERGVLTRETASMQTVKAWMAANPQEARMLMWANKSFVFFRRFDPPDETLGAVGAAAVQLTPLHSMAVDRAWWAFGTPFWIETRYPPEAGRKDPVIARLMIAQDTGSAIKGFVRGDFYWGWGDDAALVAGHMKSPGVMTALLPHAVAESLGLPR